MNKALFIGRFQPFHLGHLTAIKQIQADKIIVGIGSSQYSGTDENPYSFEERKQMVDAVLKHELDKPSEIFAIPDIHDEKKWVDHVVKIVGIFDVVYTGNDWVKKLFEEKGYEVRPVDVEIDITATKIRDMIKTKNEDWEKYISKHIINLLV